jgi:hypothetical protein
LIKKKEKKNEAGIIGSTNVDMLKYISEEFDLIS